MVAGSRREWLLGALALAVSGTTRPAGATLLRGLTLPALVARSQRVAVIEPLSASCRYALIGGRRSIVTDTLVRIHELWGDGAERELVLRTLGGRLDGVGELVHGQPQLSPGERGVAFLTLGRSGREWWATGMAQGHYPLRAADPSWILQANRGLPSLVDVEHSAVRRLVGRELGAARELVRDARPR